MPITGMKPAKKQRIVMPSSINRFLKASRIPLAIYLYETGKRQKDISVRLVFLQFFLIKMQKTGDIKMRIMYPPNHT